NSVIEQESFASVEPVFAEHGVVFTQFTLTGKMPDTISTQVDSQWPLSIAHGAVRDTNGHALIWISDNWKWDPSEKVLAAHLTLNQSATLAVATTPMPAPAEVPRLTA